MFKNLGWLENDNCLFFTFWTAMLIASVHHVIGIQSDIPTRAIQVRREIVPIVVLNLFCPWWSRKLYVDRLYCYNLLTFKWRSRIVLDCTVAIFFLHPSIVLASETLPSHPILFTSVNGTHTEASCLVCFSSSRSLAEYSSWMFLTTKHTYRVNKFIINWFPDKKKYIYTERPSIVKGIFSLGYPCVNSTLMSNFSNPSPQVPLIWHADNFATIWNSSSSSLGTISSAQQTTKGFCLNLWSRI